METIAVHCSWADSKLLSNSHVAEQLPSELLRIIRLHSGSEYLNALSSALLIPQFSDCIFQLYEPVVVDLLARAFDAIRNVADSVRLLCACARLLPYLPSLTGLVRDLLSSDDPRHLGFLSEPADLRLASFGHTEVQSLLLAVFRLFSCNIDVFKDGIAPVLLSSLCRHEVLPIRYLANRCLALYMQLTDAATQDMLCSSLPKESIEGHWEDKEVDYRLLSLHEEERWTDLTSALLRTREDRNEMVGQVAKELTVTALSPRIFLIGEILILRQAGSGRPPSSLVPTRTTIRNLTEIGRALLNEGPFVLTGSAGSGKTSLLRDIALTLDKLSSMVTLYLNEQTDAKSLLGLYTTTPEGGSFIWQPGVLTQAVKEGRWVLIENLDQAGPEVLSILVPVIEHGELLLPNRRECIRASPDFKILATIRTNSKARQETASMSSSLLGGRLWHEIPVLPLDLQDVEVIVQKNFPLVQSHCPMAVRILQRLRGAERALKGQSDGLRELLRWCQRMQTRLESASMRTSEDPVPEALYDDFLLDGVDCLVGALPAGHSNREDILAIIAEELHCSPQRSKFLLNDRSPEITDRHLKVDIGKERLQKSLQEQKFRSHSQPFAKTRHFRTLMESIAACVRHCEPTLLVGETGIGKTAIIQYLAAVTGQELTVINLSQQSESADLIGGFKPVSVRSIIVPLAEEFDQLFDGTFSAKRNESFLISVRKSIVKQNWQRLLLLWDESIRMADDTIKRKVALHEQSPNVQLDKPPKRRRIDAAKFETLHTRWIAFASRVKSLAARMSGGKERFAFNFVEGKLVTALRRGHWVLLDEINLATSETLETISSILNHGRDGLPSILLSDAGQVDRVYGVENFRVFASMNPSTDVGKKDLLPALRSRFTELFVNPPDTSIQDLVILIQTYVGPLLTSDQRAASDLALLYLDTKALADKSQLSDGAGHPPHFSIRTLVRCLLYTLQHMPTYGLRRAIHEGFSMSFITVLNSESEHLLLSALERRIFGNHRNARASLNQTLRPPADKQNFVQFKHYWVSKGESDPIPQPHYIVTPFVERNLLNLARATSMKRFPILLQGPTSSGKTSMIEYLANISGNKFVRINNHEHTDLQEYLGTYGSDNEGKLHYRDGVLVDAIRNGKWVVLDELNLAPTDVLEALNRLLDDNRELLIPETQEIVRPHPHFMLFATQNPAGVYGGRKYLSRAFRNRFIELHFDDIPENELEFILQERSQIAPSQCAKIVAVYKKLSLLRQTSRIFEQRHSFVTLRDLFRWALRPAENSEELAQNGFMLLAERVRDPVEKNAVRDIVQDVFRVQISEDDLYGEISLQRAGGNAQGMLTWTPAARRLFILVSKALASNEPVLLIGETGCGKTHLCQAIAQAYGKKLNIVNAHSNTEAGDLIGAQRPVRNRALIEQTLLTDLKTILTLSGRQEHLISVNLESLLALFKDLSASFLDTVDNELLSRIRTNITRAMSLFEWVDGYLTEAMKEGHHFLLDEISLADDSVLERLNSILEPRRTLFLAEKGFSESDVVAAHGFQFMATMNPGGDHGKRELSAALRNRLTEIWVPNLTEQQDILPILHEKLQAFPALPAVMIAFAKWFHDQFHSVGRGQISLRNLLGFADFIRGHSWMGPAEAVAQGALLVYIDSLGANPAGSNAILPLTIAEARARCIGKLGKLLKEDLSNLYGDLSIVLKPDLVRVGPFSIQRAPGASSPSAFIYEAPTTLENTMRILRALQLPRPILLEGNPGVGKTALITALASMVGKPLTRINLSEQTDLMDLFGSDVPMEGGNVGTFAWRDGPFLKAMQNGDWVLLDEMNLASQSVLEGLNSCIDHRQDIYIAELGRSFRRHPDFVLFAAQNFHQHGGGRKGLPVSFTNRFTVVYADVLKSVDLETISRRSFPDAPSEHLLQIITFAATYNAQLSRESLIGHSDNFPELNLRDILRWLTLCQSGSFRLSPRQFLDIIVSQRLRKDDRKHLTSCLWQDAFHEKKHQPSYFHNLTRNHFQVGLGFMRRISTTKSVKQNGRIISTDMLPVLESLVLCIEHNWPVILVGKSGCGKSLLLRTLASLRGAKLLELSLSRETDATDLVGGFEQLDYDRLITEALGEIADLVREKLAVTISEAVDTGHQYWLRMYQLIGCTRDVKRITHELFSVSEDYPEVLGYAKKLANLTDMANNTSGVTFQWVDGMLLDALESGSWVVLDNANLCNPSVLDRLNSLLEFDGYLVINEQHTLDGVPRIVRPHPNFRIFLTVDPRYGELSRAMRNRSIELYIDDGHTKPSIFQTPKYVGEADISRLRLLNRLEGMDRSASLRITVMDAVLDNMASDDLCKANLLAANNSGGSDRFQAYRELAQRMQTFASAARVSAYMAVGSNFPSTFNLEREQPIRSLVNEPLVLLSKDRTSLENHKVSHWLQGKIIETLTAQKQLRNVQATENFDSSQMTVLQRSIASLRIGKFTREVTSSIADNLSETLLSLNSLLNSAIVSFSLLPEMVTSGIDSLLNWIDSMMYVTCQTAIAEARFRAYMEIGWKISSQLRHDLSHINFLTKPIPIPILQSRGLDLSSGKALQRMWPVWRPMTAKSEEQIEAHNTIEKLTGHLSEVPFDSFPAPRQLAKWRSILTDMSHRVLAGETYDLKPTEELKLAFSQIARSPVKDRRSILSTSVELLSQCRDLESISPEDSWPDSEDDHLLAMLAKRPVDILAEYNSDSAVPRVLSSTAGFAGWKTEATMLTPLDCSPSLYVLMDLSSISLQPIAVLHSLNEEVKAVARLISSQTAAIGADNLANIRKTVQFILENTFECHSDIARFHNSGTGNVPTVNVRVGVPEDHYFRQIARNYLEPAIKFLSNTDVRCSRQLLTGAALFSTCLGVLHLIVPDKPFDPALESIVERDLFISRREKLKDQLESLKWFERTFSGQSTNMRCRLLESKIEQMEQELPLPTVYRPDTSDLSMIQQNFSNVIHSILSKKPEEIFLSGCENMQESLKSIHERQREYETLRQNVTTASSRLLSCPQPYRDLTVPVMRTLQCLEVGARLIVSSDREQNDVEKAVWQISNSTPLLGARPNSVFPSGRNFLAEKTSYCTSFTLFHNLDLQAADHGIRWKPPDSAQRLTSLFQKFYEEWKHHLEIDQALAAKRSKFYHYQGENVEEEVDTTAMRKLFPDFADGAEYFPNEVPTPLYDPKATAIKLANAHQRFLNGDNDNLTHLVHASQNAITELMVQQEGRSTCLSPDAYLSLVFLQLQRDIDSLGGREKNSADVYFSSNIREAHKLVELVRSIQDRFAFIGDSWPEHATPRNVLQCCSEILNFKINDPIARMLVKAEKLHGIVSEWQIVASSEFSAALSLHNITDLVISWRRLEMMSWAKLLDAEDHRAREEAMSWWFLLYEIVVAIPQNCIQNDEQHHAIGMTTTLNEFISNSPMGQYRTRMNMLGHFSRLLQNPESQATRIVVTNVIEYHDRRSAQIARFLSDGRKRLAKDIKEQIKLASWKDTNVVALRESAKRSHHKLFKIVRQYRALIGQSVSNVMTSVTTPTLDDTNSSVNDGLRAPLYTLNPSILSACQAGVVDWGSRPERLREFAGAAASMRQVYRRSLPRLNVAEEVGRFTANFAKILTDLRKETPAKLTDDNIQFVKQLKSRKRRFLADVLKALRQMGVPSNLDSNQLAQQDTTEQILVKVANIDSNFECLREAGSFYYGFLDVLSLARTRLPDYNDELNPSEVTRGAGFSEGLMHMLKKQRNNLALATKELQSLKKIVNTIKHLEACWSEKPFHCLQADSKSLEGRLHYALAWLPPLLDMSSTIADAQQQFGNGDLNFTSIIAGLSSHAKIIAAERDALNDKNQRLHTSIRSASDLESMNEALSKLATLKQDLESWHSSQPQLRYLLKQLIPWADLDGYPDNVDEFSVEPYQNGSSENTSESIDRQVSSAIDKIFVAMQLASDACKQSASSTEDIKWLTYSESSVSSSLKALHMSQVVVSWEQVLSDLGKVSPLRLQTSIALSIIVLPVLEQYLFICQHITERFAAIHYETCKMSFGLGRAFSQILIEGFCSPPDSSAEGVDQGSKIEDGTGLGDGEGAEDISKDVGDDEDLSEFAHQGKTKGEGEEIDAAEDAVDMGNEDLEGDIDKDGEIGESDEAESGAEDGDEAEKDIDEEAGDVDDLDPAAVDEKLWDGLAKDDEKELENQDAKGAALDEQATTSATKVPKEQDHQGAAEDRDGNEVQNEEMDNEQDSVSEEVANAKEALDHMDPYLEQEKPIDLPEEMQLDGDKGRQDDAESDDALDECSDVENTPIEDEAGSQGTFERSSAEAESVRDDQNDISVSADDHAKNSEEMLGDDESMSGTENEASQSREDNNRVDISHDAVQGDSGTAAEAIDEQENAGAAVTASTQNAARASENNELQDQSAKDGSNGTISETARTGAGRLENPETRRQQEAFQKLGDIFERWHRQKHEILQHSEEHDPSSADFDMVNTDFEHVRDENDTGDAQALGAATEDQARGLDEDKAIEDPETRPTEDQPMYDTNSNDQGPPEPPVDDNAIARDTQQEASAKDTNQGAFIPNHDQRPDLHGNTTTDETLEDVLSDVKLEDSSPSRPASDPLPSSPSQTSSFAALWPYYSALTHQPSLHLASQLRLLLPPTTATKLRGDYRTGKRLNMKRIIPFIASGYRRDKIWLRRSLPSKRNYQVIVAVDDSRSMLEGSTTTNSSSSGVSGGERVAAPGGLAGQALEALALVAKGLSMLEIGSLAILAFGSSMSSTPSGGSPVTIAHPFTIPFTESAGPEVFSHFTFRQPGTDVAGLVRQSVSMFREAREQQQHTSSNTETWQLEIILGDAVFDNHDEVRRMVRAAGEERIAFVYVIVDPKQHTTSSSSSGGGGQSILDLQRATFDAEGKLVMKRYLETFPFPYYVIVREVAELGGVLCDVLRGWFGEVGGAS